MTAYICTPQEDMHTVQLRQKGTAVRFLNLYYTIMIYITPAYIAGKSRGAFRHIAALAD